MWHLRDVPLCWHPARIYVHALRIRIKQKYSDALGFESIFTYPVGLLIFPTGITWAVGWLVNQCTIPLSEHTHIPPKKALLCAITVSISTITYTYAIYWSNYPVVMMVKSCNILSVILVSVLCSRVKDQKLKLGSKKILVGVLVTLGIVVFKYYDQEGAVDGEKKTEVLGIVLLIISLLADGFLPDFQAEIKSVHKPQAM